MYEWKKVYAKENKVMQVWPKIYSRYILYRLCLFLYKYKQQEYRHGQWIPGALCPAEPLRIQHYFRYSTIVDSTIVFHELLRSDLSFQGLFLLSPYPHDFGS